MGNTFDYAEMAYLIFPRPFMVERGHHDHVSEDRLVAYEYAKVRWLYVQFGLSDRTQMEYFNGGHTINGQGTFGFLCKHLDWPCPFLFPRKEEFLAGFAGVPRDLTLKIDGVVFSSARILRFSRFVAPSLPIPII